MTGIWDWVLDYCVWPRYGDGDICKLSSVYFWEPKTKALTTNYDVRNISSTCSSSGSALWASAKNIKPLVDANCHTEAIEFGYHQSPIRFSPIYYQNPGSTSLSPRGQTILFGCPVELRTVGEMKKLPLILEYLLGFSRDQYIGSGRSYQVRQSTDTVVTNWLHWKVEEGWRLLNEVEHAWTGVEKSDRAFISWLVDQGHLGLLILVCLLSYTVTES